MFSLNVGALIENGGALAGWKAYDPSQGACATSSHMIVVVLGWVGPVLPDFLNV